MKTILLIILVIFVIIILIAFLVPFLGIGALIGYVLKNSLQKKTPEFLQNEKIKMEEKVNDLKKDIENWKKFTVNDITNNLQYSYSKGMSNRLTGRIYSQNNLPIIAFQRIDRGVYTNSRILARSTDFKIYYEYTNNENLIFYDDLYLGKIINNSVILNTSNIKIGNYNRNNSNNQNSYSIEFESKMIAEVNKNTDRKNFITNPFYNRPNSPYKFQRSMKNYQETEPSYSLINANDVIDKEEIKWIIAIGIFESIYYGFDFTS